MKYIYKLFFILSGFALQAQIVDIPDDDFKNFLITELKIDTNNDGEISYEEAKTYKGKITLPFGFEGYEITDITGIGAFKNIKELHLSEYTFGGDKINLKGLTELKKLTVSTLIINDIDLSDNRKIEELYAANLPNIKSIDLSQLTELKKLILLVTDGKSQIKHLDLSNNKKLTMVRCNDMGSLEWINVANGNNKQLESFHFYGSPIKAIIYDSDFDYLSYNTSPPPSDDNAPSHYKWIGINSAESSVSIDSNVMVKNPEITVEKKEINSGSDAVFIFKGLKNTGITYTINGVEETLTIGEKGEAKVVKKGVTKSQTLITTNVQTIDGVHVPISFAKQEVTIKVIPPVEFKGITKKEDICKNGQAIFHLSGTKSATVVYTVNGNESVVTLDENGEKEINISSVKETQVIEVLKITKGIHEIIFTDKPTATVSVLNVQAEFIKPKTTIVNQGQEITLKAKEQAGLKYAFYLGNQVLKENNSIASFSTKKLKIGSNEIKLVVTNSKGCTDEETINITVLGSDVLQIIEGNAVTCNGENVKFIAKGGIAYEFYVNGVSKKTKSTENTFEIENLKEAVNKVKVKVYNANGASKFSPEILVKVNPKPTSLTLKNNAISNTIEQGTEIIFTASGADTYEFFVGDESKQDKSNSNIFKTSELKDGDLVKVIGYTSKGCSDEKTTLIKVKKSSLIPILKSSANDNIICKGDQVIFTALPKGSFEYSFILNGDVKQKGASNIFKTTSLSDNDTLIVKINANKSASIITKVIDLPTVTLVNGLVDNSTEQGDLVKFKATGGSNYEFFINNISKQAKSSSATFETNDLNDGDKVKVKVWNANNCFSEVELPINVRRKLFVEVEKGVPICDGVNGSFVIRGAPGIKVKYNFKGRSKDDFYMLLKGTGSQVVQTIVSPKPIVDEMNFEYETLIIKELVDLDNGTKKTDNLPVVTLDKFPNSIRFENSEEDFTIKKGATITFEATKHDNLIYAFYVNGEKVQDFSKENTFTPIEELKDGYQVMLKVANQTKSCVSEFTQVVHVNNDIGDHIEPVDDTTDYKVKLTNGFSPNDDGINDFWQIMPNVLSRYPNNILKVFNRSGSLVYEANSYNNNWDGVANKGTLLSGESKLPVGSYYYIFDTGKGKVYRGWLYINY